MSKLNTSEFRAAASGVRVTPPVPQQRAVDLPDSDAMDATDTTRDASSGWAAFLTYRDSAGQVSERRITCRSISGEGQPVYFSGYCHERKAPRTFRIDRVVELVDYDTGELVDPLRRFADLRMHGLLPMRDRSLADLAVAMVFMAKCDGEYHPMEESAIEDGLSRYLIRCGGSDNEMLKVMDSLPSVAPDSDDAADALDRLLAAQACPSIARLILDSSSNVMAADGKFREAETLWSSKLTQLLHEAAAA